MHNFRGFAKKSATIFWSFIFHILVPRLDYFRSKKETQNFRIQKCHEERNWKNSYFRKPLNCI